MKGNPDKARRQARYIEARQTREHIEIDYGHFLSKTASCYRCGRQWAQNEEKRTDVNIAVLMLEDAYDDRFDTAVIISGDSDLTAPIQAVRRRFRDKRVLVAFPPKRYSKELGRVADHAFRIFARNIRASRLPPSVTTSDGTTLMAPQGWLPAAHQKP